MFLGPGTFRNGTNNDVTGGNMVGGDGTGDNVDDVNIIEGGGIGGNITGGDRADAGEAKKDFTCSLFTII